MAEPLLRIEGLRSGYGDVQVLWGMDLEVATGEIACIVGSNGAGKTTLLRTISGVVKATAGSIRFAGEAIENADPEAILRRGIAHVPEGRRLFKGLSVRDNLLLGGSPAPRSPRHCPGSGARLPHLSDPGRAPPPGRDHTVRWRAADVRGRPRDHVAAAAADAGRAFSRAGAAGGGKHRGGAGRDQQGRRHDAGGRARRPTAFELGQRGFVIELGRVTKSGETRVLAEDAKIRRAYMGV